ncbi:hypothetical protein V6N13_068260 [Hibiscus sabdariffa]
MKSGTKLQLKALIRNVKNTNDLRKTKLNLKELCQRNQGRSPCWRENVLWDMDRSGKGDVVSDGAIAGAKRKVYRLLGAVETARAIGPRGGVCSAGA